MKHFINKEMLAPNVFTVAVDTHVVETFSTLATRAETDPDFCTLKPDWSSDIRWISPKKIEGFRHFDAAFESLQVARHVREYLDVQSKVQLYAGFFHIRSECEKADFHVDWTLTNNEAFTLLTPISGYEGQTLLYKKMTGETAEYQYRYGEAIIFGDHFRHSTPPGSWEPPFTFLVFNFGTDKMVHWDKIKRTTGRQCRLIRRPDGEFVKLSWAEGVDVTETPLV